MNLNLILKYHRRVDMEQKIAREKIKIKTVFSHFLRDNLNICLCCNPFMWHCSEQTVLIQNT